MNWLYYIAEANIYLSVFYLAYYLFLSKETFYQQNRGYLLLICIVSFLLPIIQIGALKPGGQAVANGLVETADPGYPFFLYPTLIIYVLGAGAAFIYFVAKLYQLNKLVNIKPVKVIKEYKLIRIANSNTAFSFFNYLFIGADTTEADFIIKHEMVHIRQKHSADILFLEVFKIINWFNPVVYLLQNSLKTVHEYIADEQATGHENDSTNYVSFLVNNAYGLSGSSITHSFFNYNLLKKRIIMLHKQRSGKLAKLKYLLAVPLCAALLCESTIGFSKNYGLIDLAPQQIKTDTGKHRRSPPPPPQPPVTAKKVTKRPPPPPPVPPVTAKKAAKIAPPPPPEPPVAAKKVTKIALPPVGPALDKIAPKSLAPPPPEPPRTDGKFYIALPAK